MDLGLPARVFTRITADANGEFSLTRTVPNSVAGGTRISFQVIAFRGANSVKSDAITERVISGSPGLSSRPANTTCTAFDRPPTSASLTLSPVYTSASLSSPIFMEQPPGDDTVWYAAEQAGRIKRFNNNATGSGTTTVLNISGQVLSGGELGMLSMTFHPDYQNNGHIYVYYTRGTFSSPRSRISRFTTTDGGNSFGSEQVLIDTSQPFTNHNGGHLDFGPDGYLYFGFGDGGSADDPGNRAQNPNSFMGTYIRIDVDSGNPYSIPPSNPFASSPGGLPEVYAWGLRNPYRWSFDRETGELWAGDVGQNAREEISVITLGGNYGWKVMEGFRCSNPGAGTCDDPAFTPPIWDYPHSGSQSVIGGYVYRGDEIPGLNGTYLFADFYKARVYGLFRDSGGTLSQATVATRSGIQISSFAEDHDGELYVLDYAGDVYKITDATPPGPNVVPGNLSETGCFDAIDPTIPASGLIPYQPSMELWSDGLEKKRWMAVPDGTTIDLEADGDFSFPIGTVLIKEFQYQGQRVETRLVHAPLGRRMGWLHLPLERKRDRRRAGSERTGGRARHRLHLGAPRSGHLLHLPHLGGRRQPGPGARSARQAHRLPQRLGQPDRHPRCHRHVLVHTRLRSFHSEASRRRSPRRPRPAATCTPTAPCATVPTAAPRTTWTFAGPRIWPRRTSATSPRPTAREASRAPSVSRQAIPTRP